MPALMVGVCPQCQDNDHEHCANATACVCALRQHPHIPPRAVVHYAGYYNPEGS